MIGVFETGLWLESARELCCVMAVDLLMARFPVQMALFAPDGSILDSNNANTFMRTSEEDEAADVQSPDAA